MGINRAQCLKALFMGGSASGITAPTVLHEQLSEENRELIDQLELVTKENESLNRENEGLTALNRGLTQDLIDLQAEHEEELRRQAEQFKAIIQVLRESNAFSQDQMRQMNDTLKHAQDQLEQQRKELQQLHLDNQQLDHYSEFEEKLENLYVEHERKLNEIKTFMAEDLPEKVKSVIDDMEVTVSPEYNENVLELKKLIEESNTKRQAFLEAIKKIKAIQVTRSG